jgi:hypothetical protein
MFFLYIYALDRILNKISFSRRFLFISINCLVLIIVWVEHILCQKYIVFKHSSTFTVFELARKPSEPINRVRRELAVQSKMRLFFKQRNIYVNSNEHPWLPWCNFDCHSNRDHGQPFVLWTPWIRVLENSSRLPGQKNPQVLWKSKVHYRVNKIPPQFLIPGQMNQVKPSNLVSLIYILILSYHLY